ncbi:putative signal transduction protein with CBS domains [Methanoregula boonei 6A8]|jgi:predicted transcriptional regulator|uniref:Putative signal transduction protein with CBS domains n=1 Tax=Methanoregula boonei (strain DSM 21154 / JCM 14090 / 6A8) TaxID=456442 RepID=A7IA55_METB6|nr:CBS domain-containing protein [Methanoregula boonei]ABS56616.1 putative signal transduction protein with CBS domains [Methanoregula boonei 6A8]
MELSLIQKDILITLITLYHQKSHSIKGEEIADMILRNPGTVRNQMQSLKAIGLVDGVPGPKGGYIPTQLAYKELNLNISEGDYDVPISRDGEIIKGAHVQEIDFTTLCHPDICHAVIKLVGSAKIFEIGDRITIGPTPVNKLLLRGEVFGKDEVKQALLIATSEMISLPKQPIKSYMSTPLKALTVSQTIRDAVSLFHKHHIHGAPVLDGENLAGIVTMSDVVKVIDQGLPLDTPLPSVMTRDVVQAPSDIKLFDVIRRFKEREIGRLVVTEDGKPVGILTQSDILRVFPSL